MLGSDGPNVNKKVFRLINDGIKALRGTGLVNIGTCNIHIVHNAFLKGLEELGIDVSDFIINVYYFFNGWPKRWEDFVETQNKTNVPHHKFLKHCSIRWLTLGPASKRVVEQWAALKYYFIDFIPKFRPNLMNANRYLNIVNALKSTTFKAEVIFVINSALIFEKFSNMFQRQEPLIHVLYTELQIALCFS